MTPVERYQSLIRQSLTDPRVTHPTAGASARGFGSDALKVDGHIFAMLVGDELVVKLPRQRVDALIAAGQGRRFDPGHGRLMKEWLTVGSTDEDSWLALADEAKEFVASG
jgi:hypothetical protein